MDITPATFFGLLYDYATGTISLYLEGPNLITFTALPGSVTYTSGLFGDVTRNGVSITFPLTVTDTILTATEPDVFAPGMAVVATHTGWTATTGLEPGRVVFIKEVFENTVSGQTRLTFSDTPNGPKIPLRFAGTGTTTISLSTMPFLSDAQATKSTGDYRAVVLSLLGMLHTQWQMAAVKPTKMAIAKTASLDRASGETVTVFSVTVRTGPPVPAVALEP